MSLLEPAEHTDYAIARRIGAAIASHRAQAGITQESMAELLCLGHQAVSRIERGAVLPSITRLFEISDLLGIRIDQLLLLSSDRSNDQAQVILELIKPLQPVYREVVMSIVKQLAEHFPAAPLDKRKRPRT